MLAKSDTQVDNIVSGHQEHRKYDRALIVATFQKEGTLRGAEKALGISRETLRLLLDKYGCERNHRKRRGGLTDEELIQAKRQYVLEGKSTHDISRIFGIAQSTIHRSLVLVGVRLRERGQAISLAAQSRRE